MPTTKQRINLTADRDIENALKTAARRDCVSVGSKAVELIRLALEIEEDLAWGTIAEQRDTPNAKFISHNKVWGKIIGKK